MRPLSSIAAKPDLEALSPIEMPKLQIDLLAVSRVPVVQGVRKIKLESEQMYELVLVEEVGLLLELKEGAVDSDLTLNCATSMRTFGQTSRYLREQVLHEWRCLSLTL